MPRSRKTREHASTPLRRDRSAQDTDLEQLAQFISHELRNPISTLQAFLTILLREQTGPLNDVQRDFVSSMLSISHRLERLSDDIRVAFADGSEVSVQPSMVDVRAVVESCQREVSSIVHSDGLSIELDIDNMRDWTMTQDPVRLAQIASNLLENAVRHSPDEGTVRLALRQSTSRLFLVVENESYQDLSESDLEALFAPYARGSSASTRHPGGSGLGLAVVTHLVAALRGRIVIRAGKGRVSIGIVLPRSIPGESGAGE